MAAGWAERGWDGEGDCGCGFDWADHVAEMDEQRDRDFEMLERICRAFRDQIGEQVKEAVASTRCWQCQPCRL